MVARVGQDWVVAQGVRAGRERVRRRQVALLIVTVMADRLLNVVQLVILSHPRLSKARGQPVHTVGSGERQLARSVGDEATALVGGDVLGINLDTTTWTGPARLGDGVAGEQDVPGVVADIVGTAGLVDVHDVNGAIAVG